MGRITKTSFLSIDDTLRKTMSQFEQKKIQSNGESLDTENSQNAVGQDTLLDPILSKEPKKTIIVGMDQTTVSGQPEDKGKPNQDEESSMKVSNVDTYIPKEDTDIKKQSHRSFNSVFRGLRSAYESFGEEKEETMEDDS